MRLAKNKTDLENKKNELQKDEKDLVNKNIWDKFKDFFNDNIKILRKEINVTKLHIQSIEQEIESLNSKIETISSMQEKATTALSIVETEMD